VNPEELVVKDAAPADPLMAQYEINISDDVVVVTGPAPYGELLITVVAVYWSSVTAPTTSTKVNEMGPVPVPMFALMT
jgi:hypothetical protein